MQKAFETKVALIDPTLKIEEKLTSDTIFQFLNAYTRRYVKQIYLQAANVQDNTRAHKDSIDAIKSLITRIQLYEQPSTRNTDGYVKQYVLPENYFLYIRSSSMVTSTYLNTDMNGIGIIPNTIISEEDAEKVITTPYNQIILRQPCVVMMSSHSNTCINVIHDKFTTIEGLDLVYYRLPKPFNVINVDGSKILDYCELPDSVHNDIVDGAVEMFITEAKYRLNMKDKD